MMKSAGYSEGDDDIESSNVTRAIEWRLHIQGKCPFHGHEI